MIPRRDIRAFANRIGGEFAPLRVILFGSYAYGKPTDDSDVDILVVFSGRRDAADRSLDIRMRLHPGFSVDILARSEHEVRRRIGMNDWFMKEIVEKGIILYEGTRRRVGRQSGGGPRRGEPRNARKKSAAVELDLLSRAAMRGEVPQGRAMRRRQAVSANA